jgi:hypothetical protein
MTESEYPACHTTGLYLAPPLWLGNMQWNRINPVSCLVLVSVLEKEDNEIISVCVCMSVYSLIFSFITRFI